MNDPVNANKTISIASAQNETYRTLLSLTSAKGLKKQDMFLLSGEKLVTEFLRKPNLEIVYEIIPAQLESIQSGPHASPALRLTPDLFETLDVLGTHYNILVLRQPKIFDIPSINDDYIPNGIEVVAPLGDPGNLGALIRSCEAFGITRIILSREAAHPFLPKCVKASAGSVLRINLASGPALAMLPPKLCIALDAEGVDINQFSWPKRALLVIGEEGPGLGASIFPTRICIPTQSVESLNAVVAASIALSRIPKP